MSDARRRSLISGCRRMTPVEEHGASSRIRSKGLPSQKLPGARRSATATVAVRFSRPRFSRMSAVRSPSTSSAVTSTPREPARSNAPVLPPGAAQGSRDTRCPGRISRSRAGQLCSGILHRNPSLGEARQVGNTPRAIQYDTRIDPLYPFCTNRGGGQLLQVVLGTTSGTGRRAAPRAGVHCRPRGWRGFASGACLEQSRDEPGRMRGAPRKRRVHQTSRRPARSPPTKRRSTAFTSPAARSGAEDPARRPRGGVRNRSPPARRASTSTLVRARPPGARARAGRARPGRLMSGARAAERRK